MRSILLFLAAYSCCDLLSIPTTWALELNFATRAIPTFQLDLTIKNTRRLTHQLSLLRGGSSVNVGDNDSHNGNHSHGHEEEQQQQRQRSLESSSFDIDSLIRTTAEAHLTNIYAQKLTEPTEVLLTVNTPSSNQDTNNDSSTNPTITNGIYIRTSFLGGVVSFPLSSTFPTAPTKSTLESITLQAFAIPGEGETFLNMLLDKEEEPALGGLLLVGATTVNADTADSTNNDNPLVASNPETTSDNDNDNDDGGMNIWAVAAVAALGAMFLVILLCTSILYCDWRKRKERRERKRESRAANVNMAQAAGAGGRLGGASANDHKKEITVKVGATGEDEYDHHVEMMMIGEDDNGNGKNNQQYYGQPALQIVIPGVPSGETEDMMDLSPSTQSSNEFKGVTTTYNTNNGIGNGNSNNGGTAAAPSQTLSSGKPSLMTKLKSSRRNLPSIKSKAANAQLQASALGDDNTDNMNNSNNNNANTIPILSQDNMTNMSNRNSSQGGQPSIDYATGAAAKAPSDIGGASETYSVGEDTTMLYPSMNRNRFNSKDQDGMSDFDGYSMDGMSAIDYGGDGFSKYGGNGSLGGSQQGNNANSGGVKQRGSSTSRDVMYAGEVPRDFDSVWGDDDQSRLTTDGSVDHAGGYGGAAAVGDHSNPKKEAYYGDLTKNLDELVEEDASSSNQSSSLMGGSSSAGGVNPLHDFDSESESGSQKRGAFTLELLGKGSASSKSKPKDDEDDSILGDMYRDETMDSVLGESDRESSSSRGGGENKVPSSGDSIDSTPSWAAPIQKALSRSSEIFRTSSQSPEKNAGDPDPAVIDTDAMGMTKESQEQRTKDKFVSSLSMSSDEGSVGSHRSNNSGSSSKGSNSSLSKRKETTAKSSTERALGLTNSMEEEVDEDPAAMIDNINSMLSECRDILDTEKKI